MKIGDCRKSLNSIYLARQPDLGCLTFLKRMRWIDEKKDRMSWECEGSGSMPWRNSCDWCDSSVVPVCGLQSKAGSLWVLSELWWFRGDVWKYAPINLNVDIPFGFSSSFNVQDEYELSVKIFSTWIEFQFQGQMHTTMNDLHNNNVIDCGFCMHWMLTHVSRIAKFFKTVDFISAMCVLSVCTYFTVATVNKACEYCLAFWLHFDGFFLSFDFWICFRLIFGKSTCFASTRSASLRNLLFFQVKQSWR